jgi:hypothetical protein
MSKIKSHSEFTKQLKSRFFLIFLLVNGRILISIRNTGVSVDPARHLICRISGLGIHPDSGLLIKGFGSVQKITYRSGFWRHKNLKTGSRQVKNPKLNGEISGGYLEPAMNPRMSAFSGLVTLLAVLHNGYSYNNFLNRGIQYNRGYPKIKENSILM